MSRRDEVKEESENSGKQNQSDFRISLPCELYSQQTLRSTLDDEDATYRILGACSLWVSFNFVA